MPFDVRRIETAVARADRDIPVALARAVANALGSSAVAIEQFEDSVDARLGEAGLDDVARAIRLWPAQVR